MFKKPWHLKTSLFAAGCLICAISGAAIAQDAGSSDLPKQTDGPPPNLAPQPTTYVKGTYYSPPPPPDQGAVAQGSPISQGPVHQITNLAPTVVTANANNDKSGSKDVVSEPIVLSTGAETSSHTYFSSPVEMGLKYVRYYISTGLPPWSDSLSYRLDPSCAGVTPCNQITVHRPEGSTVVFTAQSSAYQTWTQGTASLTHNADGTFTLQDEDASIEIYSASGQIQSLKNVSGIGWTFSYNATSSVTTVTHTNGQQMTIANSFTLNPAGQVASTLRAVTDPAGNVYDFGTVYTYLDGSNQGGTDTVTLPGSPATVITYKYPNSGPLSETDYNGVPYSYVTYAPFTNWTTAFRVSNFHLADGSQSTSVTYTANGNAMTATITNPLGHVSVNQYGFYCCGANEGYDLLSVSDTANIDSVATIGSRVYDNNNNLQQATDSNGNITKYAYAANGLLQTKTEAYGTAQARTTNFDWDPNVALNRITSETVVGWSETSYTYNAQDRLASVSVTNLSPNGTANQTLTTTYNYTLYANGMVQTMSVTHPSPNNSDTDVSTYDALGNVTSFADGLGHTTTYSNYNGLNEVGHVVGPNGDATDYTYDARGRISTKTTYPYGIAGTWTYTYDGFGLPYTLTTPDNEVTTWNRNAEMMVQTITHNDKDGTSTETFGYDPNGDVTSHLVTRGSDVGLSETAQYDAVGRLYQKSGNNGQTVTYGYDGNGNVLTATDAAGHVVTNQYDHLDRVSQSTESGGASPPVPTGSPTLTVPATSTTGSYTVSWTAVTGANRYILQEGGVAVINGAATSWTASGKANGTYTYQVKACNATGCGPLSAASSVTVNVPAPPASAPSLSVPASSTTGSYAVSWTSVANTSSYNLQERLNGGGWTTVQSAATTSWNASGRGNGSYGYQTQACNAVGCGPWSAVGTIAVTLPAIPAAAPALTVPATNATGSYSVSWGAVGGASTYILQQQVNGGGWLTLQNSAATSLAVSGETNGSYGYRVQGCNISGCGPAGTGTTVVTIPVPIAINGQSYQSAYAIPQMPANSHGAASIGFDITGGTTWEVFAAHQARVVVISGPVPSTATTVQYTWISQGAPLGAVDDAGSLVNAASSPTAVSSNPSSSYGTGSLGSNAPSQGRTYQLTVTFFNAAGANISSSTCTLTAKTLSTK